MNSCPICLETISSTKASPDVCDHLFCLQCLTKWSKLESFCPVDRKRFRKIINLDTGTSCEVKRRGRKRKAVTLYDVTAFCEICDKDDKDETLMLCDSCDLAYHIECLSPPLSAVPSGRWFCPVCSSIDRRLEHGEELSKLPREESCQSFFQTSNCSTSTQASLEAVKSSRDNSAKQHIYQRNNLNGEGSSSKMVQSLSFPSTSSTRQLNAAVKISKEDYQTLCCTHSLYLSPGIRVCDSSERLMSNSEVKLGVSNLPEKKYAGSDVQNSRSSKTSSNLLTSCNNSDKYEKHSKMVSLSGKEKQKLESVDRILDVPKRRHHSSDSDDCEVIFDGSNCVTISDNLSSRKFDPKISFVTSQAEQNSKEISSDNQPNVDLSRPASPNSSCLRDVNLTETLRDHVSETEDEDDSSNPLNSFEIRSSQYAAKAKMNLPRELKQIEDKKWILTPQKRAKDSTESSSSKASGIIDIIDYTRRVKKGKHLHTSCEILNKYKAFVARNAKKSNSEPKVKSDYDLNVFQCLNNGGTKMRFMHFNPSEEDKEDATSNLKTCPALLRRDFQDLSMREDGSLFLKWSMKS